MTTFRDLGVSDEVVGALAARGIEAPFPIQIMVIEDATSGRDTLARSKTGSGKTLGFAIPIVDQVDPDADRRPAALVLTPTRELAQQVSDAFEDIAKAKGLRVMAVYGGTKVREQSKGRRVGAHPDRDAGTARRPRGTRARPPGRRRDPRARRGRPDARHGVPAAGRSDRASASRRIVRRCSSPRRSTARSARMADVYTRNPVRHEVDTGSCGSSRRPTTASSRWRRRRSS